MAAAPRAADWPGDRAAGTRIIPSESCDGYFLVPVTLDRAPSRPLLLLVDTGASVTTIDPDAVERVADRLVKTGRKVITRDACAGPLCVRKLPAHVHDMDHLSMALGREIDGILGFPTFKELLLILDYPNMEVRVGAGRLPAVDGIPLRGRGCDRPEDDPDRESVVVTVRRDGREWDQKVDITVLVP